MGGYYARKAGLSDAVADAAKDHYAPLGPSDDVPTAPVSIAVALAEKIDKLTGFWAIDEKPTGSKDPFALRRAALGVIRILVENDLSVQTRLTLNEGFNAHAVNVARAMDILKLQEGWQDDQIDNLLSFIHDRLKVYLRDQGIRHDIIDACIAMDGSDDLTLLVKRARALSETLKTDDGENLIQGFKRANNILSQAEEADGVEYSFGADPKFAETEAEKDLFAALDKAEAKITPAMAEQDFSTAMAAMAQLRGPIDAFFGAVQVNAENPTVRRNRLNLLSRIRAICSAVADLTKLDG